MRRCPHMMQGMWQNAGQCAIHREDDRLNPEWDGGMRAFPVIVHRDGRSQAMRKLRPMGVLQLEGPRAKRDVAVARSAIGAA